MMPADARSAAQALRLAPVREAAMRASWARIRAEGESLGVAA